jgi:hypothetical protein
VYNITGKKAFRDPLLCCKTNIARKVLQRALKKALSERNEALRELAEAARSNPLPLL